MLVLHRTGFVTGVARRVDKEDYCLSRSKGFGRVGAGILTKGIIACLQREGFGRGGEGEGILPSGMGACIAPGEVWCLAQRALAGRVQAS